MRLFALLLILLSCTFTFAQSSQSDTQADTSSGSTRGEGPIDPTPPQGVSVDQIIQKFAAKESEFRQAWDQYAFRQDVKVQTLDGDTVDGEYREVTDVTFTDAGKRIENVQFAPQSTLQRLSMDREDFEDIRHRYPFVMSTEELPQYQVLYVGKQKVDELDTYVFDIAPKTIEKNKRYVQGRLWVDQQDLQIVKTHLKPVYQMTKELQGHQFPAFTTYREQIDGTYWFPTYVKADEELHFPGGRGAPPQDVHIRIIVKYTDYKRFGAKSRIIFNGEELPEQKNPQQPQQQPQQQTPPPKPKN
jgi:hypothetical protein